MKRIQLVLILVAICFAPVLLFGQTKNSNLNIIPKPVSVVQHEGTFILSGLTKFVVVGNDDEVWRIAEDFAASINVAKHTHINMVQAGQNDAQDNHVIFKLSDDADKYGTEGYTLDITPRGITIEAHQPNGIFYAVQTIYQLLPYQIFSQDAVGSMDLSLPCVKIFDKPRFAWRGNMLDVSRHFISIDYLKQNLDMLASLKMNKFHWHLTDDQGWRIEIKSYPNLTETGAWRVDRNKLDWHNRMEQQPGEIATYGGYYTQEQIKEIINYAQERFIDIIPEIDMPGHSRAAIASYPEISCDGADYKVATGGIMNDNTYCPGKEITFEFTERMLNEVMDLFPSQYMHIGGDECNKEKWETCEDCQKRIKDNNLADEHELQSYFIKRVEKIINARGKKMIGWDEIMQGGLAPNATVMSWRGTKGGIEAAKAGHDVVMTPHPYCYLDFRQGSIELEPDYGYSRLLLSTAYSYNPAPDDMKPEVAKHILGVQGNLWAESMQTPFDLNYMMFPRLFAIAEVGWTPYALKNYDDFVSRTDYAFNRLDAMHVNYAPSMYNITINHEGSIVNSNLTASLSADVNNIDIYYTLDGTSPDATSTLFTQAIPITKTTTIKAQAYKSGEALGRVTTKTILIHKAAAKKVEYFTQPNEKYNTSELCLTDCIHGPIEYSKEFWTAFRGSDVDLQIDLENIEDISTVKVSFLHNTRSWIFLPLEVQCEISVDGKAFASVGTVDLSASANQPGKLVEEAAFNFDTQQARYVRIKAKGMKINPEWHYAPGGENWIFMDEITVN